MPAAATVRLLALIGLVPVVWAENPVSSGPTYSTASIVNAATNRLGLLSPNAIVSLYGTGLSYNTRALSTDDIRNDQLPTTLIGTGVRVLVDNLPVVIYFVSPGQINFLLPSNIKPGKRMLQVNLDGKLGPKVEIELADTSPGFFQQDQRSIIATHVDGSVVTADAPAAPGEVIVLYAAGLGQTQPNLINGIIPKTAAAIERLGQTSLFFNGDEMPRERIYYAGVTPGFAGLYQVNVKLPEWIGANPEIRLQVGDQSSPIGVTLPLRRE
jgi:uncharacterized protein (TIGR03437 family)